MIIFPGLLAPAAKAAGMKVPDNIDNFNSNEYIHFHVFITAQLGQPMPRPGVHWDNAKVVADLTEQEVHKVSMKQLIEKGFDIGYPIP